MKDLRYFLLTVLMFVVLVFAIAHQQNSKSWVETLNMLSVSGGQGCKETYRTNNTVKIKNTTIKVEIANTDAARQKGLGGRECIAPNQGMLFVFHKSGYYSFWMKDMNFPIDIVWINANKRVVATRTYVLPTSYPQNFVSSAPAKYVLELGAGMADTLGLQPETSVNFSL